VVKPGAPDTIDLLRHLIEFDTTSRHPNRPMIDWIASFYESLGASVEVLPSNDSGGAKANLIASFGPDEPGGVVLCGHTDVVPVDGQRWSHEPFTMTEDGSRLYGRGTTDMKGFIASVLAASSTFQAAKLVRPIMVALTHDEEVGCLGAPALATALLDRPAPAAVITGEPTEMRVVRAHKGIRVMRTTVAGRAAHSSRPDQAASAVSATARIVSFIDELAAALISRTRDDEFTPPYTTMNVGTISGGTAVNIVPSDCTMSWEFRFLPGLDPDAVQAEVQSFIDSSVVPLLRERAPEASVETEVMASVPPLDAGANESAAALVVKLVANGADHAGGCGAPVSYGTDAAVLQSAGLPSIVCGPGSMAQGHQPDEFIERAQLERCDTFLQTLGAWAARRA
jgi:acetylornithine deacetylase